MTGSPSGRPISVGAVSTGPAPGSRGLESLGARTVVVSVLNGASEQPEIASRAASVEYADHGQQVTFRESRHGNPVVAGLSTAPGGQSGSGSSSVPTSNGRLTADPLQYGEVSRPEK